MKKSTLYYTFLIAMFSLVTVHAQDISAPVKPAKKMYWLSASEFIFSGGSVAGKGGPDTTELNVNPIVRFTCFFHLQEQFHIDFNEHIGMYTGLGIRNVGMINDLNDTIKVKQRAYSLGVPIALKLGSLPDHFNIALGAELELFFHYKQKVFYDDEKFKKTEWFSNKVNIVNPSVFLDIHSGKGVYVRFKYYLIDFLVEDKQDIKIYGNPYPYKPESSKMFYVSIGTTIKAFTSKTTKKAGQSVNTTLLY
jgi:hypothetical protein